MGRGPGSQGGGGGLAAEQVEQEQFLAKAAEQDYPIHPEMERWEAANLDLDRLVGKSPSGHRRRASPRWPTPTEIW
eukprot:9229570-Pyramimonas_sp.AAC.1